MSARRAVALAAAALAAAGAIACLAPSLDGLSGGATPDAGDAGAADGAGPLDASGPVLLKKDDFEQGCGDWDTQFGQATASSVSHSGTGACVFCCGDASVSNYCTLDRGSTNAFVPSPPVGTTYYAEGWVRSAPQTNNPAATAELNIRLFDGIDYIESSPTSPYPVSATWTRVPAQLKVSKSGTLLNAYVIMSKYKPGDCFIVDDVSIYKITDGG